ncbi:DedA family protein [Streptomyces sp. NPDC006270]|uniref:DedA family protein n=1 Tax=Streptomyces sp. NPDC006270 TaxID=3364741 RepID=UPI0036869CA3
MQIEAARFLLQPELIVAIALIAVMGDALVPVLPSGSLVLAAASFSLGHGPAPLALVLAVAASSFLGDLALVTVARSRSGRIGARMARHAGAAAAAQRMRDALTRRLGRATLAARFVPGGRTMLGLVLDGAPRQRRAYLRWSALGGLVWAGYLVGLGCLNGYWFDTRWVGFAVSASAGVAISATLARAVRRSGALGAEAGPGPSSPAVRSASPAGPAPIRPSGSPRAAGRPRGVPLAPRCPSRSASRSPLRGTRPPLRTTSPSPLPLLRPPRPGRPARAAHQPPDVRRRRVSRFPLTVP